METCPIWELVWLFYLIFSRNFLVILSKLLKPLINFLPRKMDKWKKTYLFCQVDFFSRQNFFFGILEKENLKSLEKINLAKKFFNLAKTILPMENVRKNLPRSSIEFPCQCLSHTPRKQIIIRHFQYTNLYISFPYYVIVVFMFL